MKKLIALLLLMPLTMCAITRIPLQEIALTNDGKTGLHLSFKQYHTTKSIMIAIRTFGDCKCISDKSIMVVTFRDGETYVMRNDFDSNCNHLFLLIFNGKLGKDFIREIQTREIAQIRLNVINSFIEIDLTEQESKQIIEIAALLDA